MSYNCPPYNYGQQPQPAPEQKRSTGKKIALFGCLPATLLALAVAGGCAVVGGAIVNEADKAIKADESADARAFKEDVKITSCKITDDEFIGKQVEAEVKITNNGKDRANYSVEGEFLDTKGDKVGELLASVSNLAPGKSTTQDFSGLITGDELKGVSKGSCSLVEVMRDEWLAAN